MDYLLVIVYKANLREIRACNVSSVMHDFLRVAFPQKNRENIKERASRRLIPRQRIIASTGSRNTDEDLSVCSAAYHRLASDCIGRDRPH